jgi:glycosyltransferase involved in cell wall biosynthesis
MLASLPVVATNVSSIPEIVVDGETGLLVPPDNAPALAAAITSVLDDPRDYRERGRARAQRKFSVGRMTDRTLAVYEKALRRRSGQTGPSG